MWWNYLNLERSILCVHLYDGKGGRHDRASHEKSYRGFGSRFSTTCGGSAHTFIGFYFLVLCGRTENERKRFHHSWIETRSYILPLSLHITKALYIKT